MKKWEGDLFAKAWPGLRYATVIPTNGETDKQRRAVMGAGVAKQAADIWPEIRPQLGRLLDTCGNHCFVLPVTRQMDTWTISFPTKHAWKSPSDIELIDRSAYQLMMLVDLYEIEKVALPRVGCGLGGLKWDDVRPVISKYLDDRFVIVHHPKFDEAPKAKAGARPIATVGAVSKAATARMSKKVK